MGVSKHGYPLFVMVFNPTNKVTQTKDTNGNAAFIDTLQGFGDFQNQDNTANWLEGLWNMFTGSSAQQDLQSNAQEFQEYMYQEYNSPEALKRQFQEAGLNTNLLGSTSFGTAQGSSGAPAVNAPATVASDVANAVTQGASNLADVPLKQSQSGYYDSYPSLNKALESKYGVEALFTEKEYEFFKDTYEWKLDFEQFNSKTMRENYYYARQRVKNARQEYRNMVKEGQILEHDVTLHEYMAKVQKEIYDYWVEHGMPPSGNWQDKFWDDYIYNNDEAHFNHFLRGFRLQEDEANRSKVESGAVPGKIKIGPVELDTTAIEYGKSQGRKIWEMVKDAEESQEQESAAEKFGVNPDPNTPEGKFFLDKMHEIDDEIHEMHKAKNASGHEGLSEKDEDKMLLNAGYPLELVYKYRQWCKYGRKGQ